MIYLDTHVVVMLHDARLSQIAPQAQGLIESAAKILISPMVYLELEYLYELKKIHVQPAKIISDLAGTLDLKQCTLPFQMVTFRAAEERWTRDPFDRIITAQARVDSCPLVTRDRMILQNYHLATWDRGGSSDN